MRSRTKPTRKVIFSRPAYIALVFGGLVSIYAIWIFGTEPNFGIISQTFLIGVGLLSLYLSLKGEIKYITPVAFSIFYILGYVVGLAGILSNRLDYKSTGWSAIGAFNFSAKDFDEFAFAACTIGIGLMIGAFTARRLLDYNDNTSESFPKHGRHRLRLYTFIWFISSVLLILLMAQLGIGRATIMNVTSLPLLNGIMYWARSLTVPILGLVLIQWSIKAQNYANVFRILFGLLLLGALGSILAVSRIFIVLMVVPAILYLLMQGDRKLRRSTLKLALVFAIFIPLVAQITTDVRSWSFTTATGRLSVADLFNVSETFREFSLADFTNRTFGLVVGRVGGSRELMLVASYPRKDLLLAWQYFVSDPDFAFAYELFGLDFSGADTNTFSFGVGLAGFSWLFLSGNCLILFFGCALQSATVVFLEAFFLRRGLRSVAIFVGTTMALDAWNSFYIYRLSRNLIALASTYLFIKYVFGISRSRKPFIQDQAVLPAQRNRRKALS